MKAAVYHGPGERSWEEVPDPQPSGRHRRDRRRRRRHDLRHRPAHPQGRRARGDRPARILGHEAVGTVEEVGTAVRNVRPGDRVLVSCISGCGTCRFCREGHYGQCLGGGGWALGHTIDGVQAEYARVPFADLSTYPLPSRRERRGRGAARRHPADQLRGRRPQRRRAPGRHGRDRRRRTDRPGRGDDREALLARPHHRDRPGRAAPRRRQAHRRGRRRSTPRLDDVARGRRAASPTASARTS